MGEVGIRILLLCLLAEWFQEHRRRGLQSHSTTGIFSGISSLDSKNLQLGHGCKWALCRLDFEPTAGSAVDWKPSQEPSDIGRWVSMGD